MAEYYVIKSKDTGLYFRGKGANRWGKYFNQASIYRVRGTAEHSIKEIAWHGERAEIVPIQITEAPTIDPESLRKKGEWEPHYVVVDGEIRVSESKRVCSRCKDIWESSRILPYCPSCGADMRGEDT